MPNRINYKHLYYFWEVAKTGNLTKTAEKLHISQSALSMQIRQLEDRMGQSLFIREGRTLTLSEAGMIALQYAENIFQQGEELWLAFHNQLDGRKKTLLIGATSTLSRNFQETFLRPILKQESVHINLQSGQIHTLLQDLRERRLDLILSNTPVEIFFNFPFRSQLISQQAVGVIGKPLPDGVVFEFPNDLSRYPLIVPGKSSNIRTALELFAEQSQIKLSIRAEVDDMAMMRLLARDMNALAIVPPVVVKDELQDGVLVELYRFPTIFENFYAITIERKFQPALVKNLIHQLQNIMKQEGGDWVL